jgi:hypothetical protein
LLLLQPVFSPQPLQEIEACWDYLGDELFRPMNGAQYVGNKLWECRLIAVGHWVLSNGWR